VLKERFLLFLLLSPSFVNNVRNRREYRGFEHIMSRETVRITGITVRIVLSPRLFP